MPKKNRQKRKGSRERVRLEIAFEFPGGPGPRADRSKEGAALFALAYMDRPWLEGRLESRDAVVVAKLLFSLYVRLQTGVLPSKKDAAQILGVEHMRTNKRYIELARELGAITIAKSLFDERVDLLVLTEEGTRLVESEIGKIIADLEWGKEMIKKDILPALAARPSVTKIRADVLEQPEFAKDARSVVRILFERMNRLLSDTLRHKPENVVALRARAHALWAKESFKDALTDINKAIEIGGWDEVAGTIRANIYAGVKDFAKAFKEFERVIEAEKDPRQTFFWRARAYERAGKWKEALADLARVGDAISEDLKNELGARIRKRVPEA